METMKPLDLEAEQRTEDKYTKAIGSFGRWQIMLFMTIAVPIKFTLPGTHFGIIFIAPKTTFRCVQLNSTEVVMNSTCYDDCTKYEYYSEFQPNIISEWGLICDRAWMANFTQTMCMFGVLVGSVIFGFISDRYGRRPGLLSACMLQICTNFVTPFCPDYWSFVAIRFVLGASTAGTMMTSFIFLMEIIGPSRRELFGCLYSTPLAFGQLFMTLVAYYFRTWDEYSFGVAVPSLIYLSYLFFIPESPKWLISVGRLEEASVVMTSAAKYNKLPTHDMLHTVQTIAKEGLAEVNRKEQKKATYLDLVRLPSLRINNLCSCIIWFVVGVSFYGGNQYIGQTSANTFVSVGLGGILQIPGLPLTAYISKVFGRRITIMSFLLITAIGNGLLAVPDEWFYLKLMAGAVGVSCGAAVFSIVYVYTTELFPTVARNMAMGASSTTSRMGSMLAPFIGELHHQAAWLPPLVYAVAPLMAIVACYCLPETRGKKLKDHLES